MTTVQTLPRRIRWSGLDVTSFRGAVADDLDESDNALARVEKKIDDLNQNFRRILAAIGVASLALIANLIVMVLRAGGA